MSDRKQIGNDIPAFIGTYTPQQGRVLSEFPVGRLNVVVTVLPRHPSIGARGIHRDTGGSFTEQAARLGLSKR